MIRPSPTSKEPPTEQSVRGFFALRGQTLRTSHTIRKAIRMMMRMPVMLMTIRFSRSQREPECQQELLQRESNQPEPTRADSPTDPLLC